MYKKISYIMVVLLLSVFSFYYTNKSIELVQEQDPITKKIKDTSEKYNISAVNATIKDNTIIPGLSGKEIDYQKSYNKMKQYGSYNEKMTVLKETLPTISIDNNYDKYIISGNQIKKSVALVFKVEKSFPKEIINILNQNSVSATFFIDGSYLEKNYKKINLMSNHELELLSYNGNYEEMYFKSSLDYLESLTNKKLKYCYAENNQKEVINLCKKLKLHTIIPTIKIEKSVFSEVKENLTNSVIISVPITALTKKELPITIKYIKSRGYTIITLEELLSEE